MVSTFMSSILPGSSFQLYTVSNFAIGTWGKQWHPIVSRYNIHINLSFISISTSRMELNWFGRDVYENIGRREALTRVFIKRKVQYIVTYSNICVLFLIFSIILFIIHMFPVIVSFACS